MGCGDCACNVERLIIQFIEHLLHGDFEAPGQYLYGIRRQFSLPRSIRLM